MFLSMALAFTPGETVASAQGKSSFVAENPQEDQWYSFLDHLSTETENEEELLEENLFIGTEAAAEKLLAPLYSQANSDLSGPAISSNTPLYLRFCSLKIPFARA